MYTPLLIIGAGPFGLSLSAYLEHLGLEHTMVGVPMGFWRESMPRGMILRSDCEWHLDPLERHTIHAFLEVRGETAADEEPLTLDFYLEYTDWFQRQSGLRPRTDLVKLLTQGERGRFDAVLDTGESLTADRVVIAPGFRSFAHVPSELAAILPDEKFEHTCVAVEMSTYVGDRVAIVGGRQSAFEWAALLAESGAASVDLIYRHETPAFEPADWSWVTALVASTVDNPGWFRGLSKAEQEQVESRLWTEGRLKLERWLVERIERDEVTLRPHRSIRSCHVPSADEASRNGEELRLRLDDATTVAVDRVILATGYRPDITRLTYLADELTEQVDTEDGLPMLSESFESSVPGLYFTSMAAIRDFGPFMAFTVSATASALILGNALIGTS